MFVTPSGIIILVRLVQPSNAPRPMFVTLSGIVTLVKLSQKSNALFILVTACSSSSDGISSVSA